MNEIDAVRHLLRNVENAAELRRNPLIAPHLPSSCTDRDVLVVVRAIVHATVAWMSDHCRRPRLHDVFVRCCLGDESRKQVAAELGISLRQLFRDCSEACTVFAHAMVRVDTLQRLPVDIAGRDEAVLWLLRKALGAVEAPERLRFILLALDYAASGVDAPRVRVAASRA